MFVGILKVELHIPGVRSLKEKRYILKSLKSKISNKFNISIAEVDHHDLWQRCTLGLSKVDSDIKDIEKTFAHIDNFINNDFRVQIINWDLKIV